MATRLLRTPVFCLNTTMKKHLKMLYLLLPQEILIVKMSIMPTYQRFLLKLVLSD